MKRNAFLLCLALVLGTAYASAAPVVCVTEPYTGRIYLLEDKNDDGDALDAGEKVLWAEGMTTAAHLNLYDGGLLATDGGADEVRWYRDLNSDGDALDAGESVLWAEVDDPMGICVDSAGVVYVNAYDDGEVYRLRDKQGDGDALDVGEVLLYADGIVQPVDIMSVREALYVSSLTGGRVYRLVDLTGDNDCMDTDELLEYTPATLNGPTGLLYDGASGGYVSSIFGDVVYHVEDLNDDNDAMDVVEVLSYADAVYGGIDGPWGMCAYGDGFLLADSADSQILYVVDKNSDGDALDIGEVLLFADGIANPVDLEVIPEPATLSLVALGAMLGGAALRRRRHN